MGRLLFSMGCHAGLDISDAEVSVSGVPTPVDDWAKTFADSGALWVANTGYGYADTDTIAYSAKLMAAFAGNLGSLTAGEALAAAKQQYAAGNAVLSPYDLKALMESTFYGLPMYRLNSPTGPVSPPPGPATSTDPVTGLTIAPVSLSPVDPARQQWSQRRVLPGHRYGRRNPDDRVPPDRASRFGAGHRAEPRPARRTCHRSQLDGHRRLPADLLHAGSGVGRLKPAGDRRRRVPGHAAARRDLRDLHELRNLASGPARPRGGPILPQPGLDDRRRHPAPVHLDAG